VTQEIAMITKEQVISLLLNSCPSFTERWRQHRAFNGEEQLLYNDRGEFAHHIVDLYKKNQIEEFPAVFTIIDRLHIEGNDYIKEAATIGLLEGIQNIAGNRGLDPEVFMPYLKPETVKWWKKLNGFWNGNITALNSSENDA
jgi:hypothetical protein